MKIHCLIFVVLCFCPGSWRDGFQAQSHGGCGQLCGGICARVFWPKSTEPSWDHNLVQRCCPLSNRLEWESRNAHKSPPCKPWVCRGCFNSECHWLGKRTFVSNTNLCPSGDSAYLFSSEYMWSWGHLGGCAEVQRCQYKVLSCRSGCRDLHL